MMTVRCNGAQNAEREFERLYLESYGLVYNYVRYRMGDDVAAEDVVAEAYLRAAKSFSKFDPSRAKFSTWVTTIAVNCMKSYWRQMRPTTTLGDVPDKFLSQPSASDEVDDRAYIDQLLGVLDETERTLVVMKYREGWRNVDIADKLQMNQSTVSTKLANALSKMRAVAKKGR